MAYIEKQIIEVTNIKNLVNQTSSYSICIMIWEIAFFDIFHFSIERNRKPAFSREKKIIFSIRKSVLFSFLFPTNKHNISKTIQNNSNSFFNQQELSIEACV